MLEKFWVYNQQSNNYQPSEKEPLSTFPTIVNIKKREVYCRTHHCWEQILSFSSNILKASCGKTYLGPFSYEGKIFHYGYEVNKRKTSYLIKVLSQFVSIKNRRLINYDFEIDTTKKRIIKNNEIVFEENDLKGILCKEITTKILDEIGEIYKKQYGIKPTISSSYNGFELILGYLLCPFNINFVKISKHWGLNPCDSDFTSMSSGDTPSAENEMFACMNIQPTKTIRKFYQINPYTIIPYAAIKDLGFTDVNLLQKSTTADFYQFFNYFQISFTNGEINYQIRTSLKQFTTDMFTISNQKTVWNSLKRTINIFTTATKIKEIINITDGINMYRGCSEHLTDREKRDIMKEGFNSYTHDFLIRRSNEISRELALSEKSKVEENVQFTLEKQFLDLEYKCGDDFVLDKKTGDRIPIPDEKRWCFYVAKDSNTLKIIGSEMHNCVGWGYKQAILERRATIVYALFNNQYKVCIEVTPNFTIRQAFGPCNAQLEGEAYKAYCEWCSEKDIVRTKVFKRQMAPR